MTPPYSAEKLAQMADFYVALAADGAYTLRGADGNVGGSGRRVSLTTRWAGDDVVWRPDFNSMQVPRIDLMNEPLGMPPRGRFFPRVWPA